MTKNPNNPKGKLKQNKNVIASHEGVSRNKLILASCLFAAALILGYFFFRSDTPELKKPETKGVLPQPAEVNAGIDSVLRDFGIESKWIKDAKENPKTQKNSTQLWFSKDVMIPVELPATNVNLELTSFLREKNLLVRTVEDPRSKNLRMDVLISADTVRGKIGLIRLSYSDSVKRISSAVCIILDSLEYLSIDDAGKIINSGEEFSVIMPLRNDKADFQSLITDRKRDYLVELTYGGEESYEADFREGMSEKEWRSKIRSLCFNFPSMSGVILRGKNLPSEFANNIKDEFDKFGMKVFADTNFVDAWYKSERPERLITELKNKSSAGSKKILMITSLSAADFEEFTSKSAALRKRGFRFIDFKEISSKSKSENPADSVSSKPKPVQKIK